MDHRERGGHPLVDQVREELVELLGRQHPLVGEGARGQRREVDVGLVLGALAQAEREPLERHPGDPRAGAGDEELDEGRHHAERHLAQAVGLDRDVAPAEDREALLGGDLLDPAAGLGDLLVVTGQERGADGVGVLRRQLEVHDRAQELVGDLEQDACAVSGVDLGTRGAAVIEVAQGGQRLGHDVVAGDPGQGRDERHATRIVLVAGVVEPLSGGGNACE